MNRWNKVINPSLIKANWSKEEDELIIKWVKEDGERGWTKIAAKLKGRIGKQCRERWINCLNPNIIKTEWTEKKYSIIIEMLEKLGNKWSKISSFLPGRSDNQIKNRWNSTLKKRIQSIATNKKDDQIESDTDIENNLFSFDIPQKNQNQNNDHYFFGGNSWFERNDVNNSNSQFSNSNILNSFLDDDSWLAKDR